MKQINKYPDGTSYAKIEQFDKEFTFRVNNYEDLWHLKQITDAYNHNGLVPTITIPWLIDEQADDRFNSNESFGLKLVCDFLNGMNADFKIFHPHNPSIVKALMSNLTIIDNSEFITIVLSKLNDKNITPTILLPDGGAYKWGVKLMDKLGWRGDVIAAAKNRKFENNKSVLTQQLPDYDFEGKSVIILDDISIVGGTFKGLSKMLKEKNCGKLYLAVSHMTVQNLGEDPVTNYFDKVFTTNSKFDKYIEDDKISKYGQPQNLEIIELWKNI